MAESDPSSPPVLQPLETASLSGTPTSPLAMPGSMNGYFSMPFERFAKDESSSWTTGLTLLDTIETYFDSRIDLLERRFKKHSEKLKVRAEEALKRTKTPAGEFKYAVDIDKEMQKFKLRVSTRMTKLSATWHTTKVVRTREKISFFNGVMAVAISALLFGIAPEWIHIVYTVCAIFLAPLRYYSYKRKAWHYFLFDLCYYTNVLILAYIWIFPSNTAMFVSSYCLAHGSLASAVITWRNSLVFHDADKVISIFIHIYPPFVLTVIRHFYPNAEARFPALAQLPHLNPASALFYSGFIYIVWQALYWKFVLVDRKEKIAAGLRTTSFSFLLNDKRGVIGRTLASIKPEYRELSFMAGQLVYALITEIPPIFLLYDSPLWSGIFLWFIFAVSVWNGGGYYIEVFGRKFERELEALRKELAETSASSASRPSSMSGNISPPSSVGGSPLVMGIDDSAPPGPFTLEPTSPMSPTSAEERKDQ